MTTIQIVFLALGLVAFLVVLFALYTFWRGRKSNPRDVRLGSSARAALLSALQPQRVDQLVYRLNDIRHNASKSSNSLSVKWQIIELKHELTVFAIEVDEIRNYLLANSALKINIKDTSELLISGASREFTFFSERIDNLRTKYLALEKRISDLE